MGPKFDRYAYGKPPPRSSRPPEVAVEANKPILDRSKGPTKELPDSAHGESFVANKIGAQNGSAAETSLKQDASTSKAFVGPLSVGSQLDPSADTCLTDTTNIHSNLSSFRKTLSPPIQETTLDSTLTQVETSQFCLLPSTKIQGDSLLPVQNAPASEIHNQGSENPVKASKAGQPQGSQAGISCSLKLQTVLSDSNVRLMTKMEKSNQGVARSDRLKQLQDASLLQITRKSAARKNRDTNNTVSIRDLDLARTPVNANEPQTSFRHWAQDSPLYGGDYENESATPLLLQKDLSVATQAPSTRTSNIQNAVPIQPAPTKTRRSKWAVKDEMKAEKAETNSNEWGSAAPSDATRPSNISDESFGKLLRNREPAVHEPLHDWEGKLMPPPADWAERPRYNNNNPDFKVQFKQYIRDLQGRFSNGIPIKVVPAELLQNQQNHPDGIGMVHRTQTINIKNAEYYGYTAHPEDAVKYARPTEDSEYEASCQLDSDDEANAQFNREETTKSLVTNWNKHIANSRRESINVGAASSKPTPVSTRNEAIKADLAPIEDTSSANEEEDEAPPLVQPLLNIYLRPATRADLSELTRIYNWYVTNGSQPAELREIDESEMQSRMDFCATSKLPFIVAACKSQKGTRPIPYVDDEELSRRCRLPVTHKQHITLTRIENLAGFCCANDFTQPDFVEHIAADIEIYVDAQHRKMGVGKCLMDKMLEICDRSHRLTMDVPFHCDGEIRHVYGPGGARDLHKMSILLRKWHSPRAATLNVRGHRKSKKLAYTKTQENDYAQWLKGWFESIGFEEEGYLTRMGAKNGRYIDLVYLGRETSWRPAEGKVPNPASEYMDATITDEGEDDP